MNMNVWSELAVQGTGGFEFKKSKSGQKWVWLSVQADSTRQGKGPGTHGRRQSDIVIEQWSSSMYFNNDCDYGW